MLAANERQCTNFVQKLSCVTQMLAAGDAQLAPSMPSTSSGRTLHGIAHGMRRRRRPQAWLLYAHVLRCPHVLSVGTADLSGSLHMLRQRGSTG